MIAINRFKTDNHLKEDETASDSATGSSCADSASDNDGRKSPASNGDSPHGGDRDDVEKISSDSGERMGSNIFEEGSIANLPSPDGFEEAYLQVEASIPLNRITALYPKMASGFRNSKFYSIAES